MFQGRHPRRFNDHDEHHASFSTTETPPTYSNRLTSRPRSNLSTIPCSPRAPVYSGHYTQMNQGDSFLQRPLQTIHKSLAPSTPKYLQQPQVVDNLPTLQEPLLDHFDSPSEESLPLDFLQSPLPNGLGLSSKCDEWLDLLNIKTWDEFVYYSSNYTVPSMMSTLTFPVYFQHRKDLNCFLVFGILCQSHYDSLQVFPPLCHYEVWMPCFIALDRLRLSLFPDSETDHHNPLSSGNPALASHPVFPQHPRALGTLPSSSQLDSHHPAPTSPHPPVIPPSPFQAITAQDARSNGGDKEIDIRSFSKSCSPPSTLPNI